MRLARITQDHIPDHFDGVKKYLRDSTRAGLSGVISAATRADFGHALLDVSYGARCLIIKSMWDYYCQNFKGYMELDDEQVEYYLLSSDFWTNLKASVCDQFIRMQASYREHIHSKINGKPADWGDEEKAYADFMLVYSLLDKTAKVEPLLDFEPFILMTLSFFELIQNVFFDMNRRLPTLDEFKSILEATNLYKITVGLMANTKTEGTAFFAEIIITHDGRPVDMEYKVTPECKYDKSKFRIDNDNKLQLRPGVLDSVNSRIKTQTKSKPVLRKIGRRGCPILYSTDDYNRMFEWITALLEKVYLPQLDS